MKRFSKLLPKLLHWCQIIWPGQDVMWLKLILSRVVHNKLNGGTLLLMLQLAEAPKLLRVQRPGHDGILLENTMPTRLLVAVCCWAISKERTAENVEHSAESLKSLLTPFHENEHQPLELVLQPLGEDVWLRRSLSSTGHFPAGASFFTSRSSREASVLSGMWRRLLELW